MHGFRQFDHVAPGLKRNAQELGAQRVRILVADHLFAAEAAHDGVGLPEPREVAPEHPVVYRPVLRIDVERAVRHRRAGQPEHLLRHLAQFPAEAGHAPARGLDLVALVEHHGIPRDGEHGVGQRFAPCGVVVADNDKLAAGNHRPVH